jgi:hypothetical protein
MSEFIFVCIDHCMFNCLIFFISNHGCPAVYLGHFLVAFVAQIFTKKQLIRTSTNLLFAYDAIVENLLGGLFGWFGCFGPFLVFCRLSTSNVDFLSADDSITTAAFSGVDDCAHFVWLFFLFNGLCWL